MIDQGLLDAVKSYSENMTRPITFVLGSGEHSKRASDFSQKINQFSTLAMFATTQYEGNWTSHFFAVTFDGI